MALIRVLTSVAGADFSWVPGDEIEIDEAEAAKWADGVRAEHVTPAKPRTAARKNRSATPKTQ